MTRNTNKLINIYFKVAVSYSIDDNGRIELNIPTAFGTSRPPSTVAGGDTKYYIYDAGQSRHINDNIYVNYDAEFSFSFTKSCTTTTKQYAEFVIGGPTVSYGTMVNFDITGLSTSTNSTEYVNIKLVPTDGGSTIDLGEVMVNKNSTTNVKTTKLARGKIYYILVTPSSKSAGHVIKADVTVGL